MRSYQASSTFVFLYIVLVIGVLLLAGGAAEADHSPDRDPNANPPDRSLSRSNDQGGHIAPIDFTAALVFLRHRDAFVAWPAAPTLLAPIHRPE
ncbi:MAG: hypothetical protein EA420_10340 [Candidatus Competibacteraceae bacterium]|nr:MAG: hypothetical protein EA420_10340 [Candidatus Competibacteraceae bacterium]